MGIWIFPHPKYSRPQQMVLGWFIFVDIQGPCLAPKGQQMQSGSDVKYRISLPLLSNHMTNRRFKWDIMAQLRVCWGEDVFSQTFVVIFLLFIVIQLGGQKLVSMAQLARAGRSCNLIVFTVLLYWDYSIYSVVYHIYLSHSDTPEHLKAIKRNKYWSV